MADVNWLNQREDRAWRAFIHASGEIRARVGGLLQRDTGMSEGDYAVLVHLSESPDGRLRAGELGCGINWEKSRLSHHIDRMVQRGLVKKQRCRTDQRGAFITITPKGRRAIEAAAPQHVEHVRQLFVDALTPQQLDNLAEICETVLAKLKMP